MKLSKYIIDRLPEILLLVFNYVIFFLLLILFNSNVYLIIEISIIYVIVSILLILMDYIRKYNFYQQFTKNLGKLDKKYLILELIKEPDDYESKILYQALYEINKSMLEEIQEYKMDIDDFKEYVEMWIHEVKIPLASLILLNHNKKATKENSEQLRRIDNYLEQILYYVRCGYSNEDYLIKKVSLAKVVKDVAMKNKNELLEFNIDFIVDVKDIWVFTDSKWLEFILNQIINNSIKYRDSKKNSYIKIIALENKENVVLTIEDNGMGIKAEDLPKVFNKSFTGQNGRIGVNSTGMGLYIVKNLLTKLGHEIKIESHYGEFTRLIITMGKNDYYNFEEKN